MRFITASLLIVGAICSLSGAAPTVDSSLLKTLQEQGTATVIVSFRDSRSDSLRKSLVFPQSATRTQRTTAIYATLKSHADEVQATVAAKVSEYQTTSLAPSSSSIRTIQLWINNQLVIYNADLALVEELQGMDEVSEIIPDSFVYLEKPIEEVDFQPGQVPQAGEQWGVAAIQAPEVWATGNKGAGVVIASTDSGVRATHEALRDNWRSLNGWYDPARGDLTPWDATGHGTHTMGTIVGSQNGIGVAPEAKFIACRACDPSGSCPRTSTLACGQWVVCPTDASNNNPRCDLAPSAVSNSWGGSQEDPWYDATIQTWVAAGIAPLFSAGNSGPACSSANSPADSVYAISIGSTDSANKVSSFSSRGPTYRTGRQKPDISAPGSAVISATYNADNSYGSKSGTSMACPHVAGLAALLYNQRSNLSVSQLREVLLAGAQPTIASGANCGGVSETTYPNFVVGQGRVSAKASVEALTKMFQ